MTTPSAAVGGFGTRTTEMARAGRHVLAVNEAIQTELRTLRARVEAMNGLWSGEAATAFRQLMARWDGDARALADALTGIGQALGASGTTYEVQEAEQRSAFSSITSALG